MSPVYDLTNVRVSTQKFNRKGIPIDDDGESGEENEPIENSLQDKLHITTAQPVENEVVTLSMTPLSILSPQPRTRAEVRKSK